MRDIATITELEILSDEIFDELFDVEDPIARDKRKAELREFAKKCGKAGAFDSRCRVYEKMLKEVAQKEAREKQKAILNVVHLTDFSDLPEKYSQLPCGTWNADDAGVRTYSKDAEVMWACQHPILPVERMKNLQTGLEQMKIAYKRDGKWQEHIFPKNIISSSNKIVGLSDYGIIVSFLPESLDGCMGFSCPTMHQLDLMPGGDFCSWKALFRAMGIMKCGSRWCADCGGRGAFRSG